MGTELELTGIQASGNELATAGAAASAQHEIQSAIIIAKKIPRNETQCWQKLMTASSRPTFAENAEYRFPRGKKEDGTPNYVTGPSVNLAREAARIWGNIRFGLSMLRDDEESRLIRGWAWDVETNTKVEVEDDFQKLIQRKKDGQTVWIVPDERDLRELTNRRGAILVRNAILQVLPQDLIEDAMYRCAQTCEKHVQEDPDKAQKRLLVDFGALRVTVEMLEKKLGHPFVQSSAKELAELRGICTSIQDGNTTWAEYAKDHDEKVAPTGKEQLKEAQEKLKAQSEQPPAQQEKATSSREKPAEQLTMAQARAALRDTTSAAEIGVIVNWALRAEITPQERAEIMDLKDAAVKRMATPKKGKP